MATQVSKGGSFTNDTLTLRVEVDRVYGSDASQYAVQVLRYVADSAGAPSGTPTVLTCTATSTPRVYTCTDASAKTGRYVYRSRVVHTGGSTGPQGASWLVQKA